MEFIIKPDNEFEYPMLTLLHPTSLQGGSYFTKIAYRDKPLYIQSPKCTTKQGIVKTGKKFSSDLMFDNNANESFVSWLEEFEDECQKLIYKKGDEWFETKLEISDIDNAFISCVRIFKSGKYSLVRTTLKTNPDNEIPSVKIYDERENEVEFSKITNNTKLITILEFQGIKFTSKTFQICIEIKQILLVDEEPTFNNCIISHHGIRKQPNHEQTTLEVNESIELKISEPLSEKSNIEDLNNIDEELTKEDESINESIDKEEKCLAVETCDMNKNDKTLEQEPEIGNYLEEFNVKLDMARNLNALTLREPYEIYMEMYTAAVEKAKKSKQKAFEAFLEAKKIKSKYNLEHSETDIDIDDELEDLLEIDQL